MILRFLPLLNQIDSMSISHVVALREKLSRSAESVSALLVTSLSGFWRILETAAKDQLTGVAEL
jgi:hypothetical protein